MSFSRLGIHRHNEDRRHMIRSHARDIRRQRAEAWAALAAQFRDAAG